MKIVAEDIVLRLLDGSHLVLIADGASPRVIEELARWAGWFLTVGRR
jgi:hypothetical protein